MSFDYALFVHEEHEAAGGWHDFVNCFPTVEEAMAQGQMRATGSREAHIVHMQERRIIMVGRWCHIRSTLTGQPGTTFFQWEPKT